MTLTEFLNDNRKSKGPFRIICKRKDRKRAFRLVEVPPPRFHNIWVWCVKDRHGIFRNNPTVEAKLDRRTGEGNGFSTNDYIFVCFYETSYEK